MISRVILLAACVIAPFRAQGNPDLSPVVVREETVEFCLTPGNGAGPLWCYGSPLLFRDGEDVFVSVMETGEGVEPLCNTRWRVFHRDEKNGWEPIRAAEDFRLREPSPLVGVPNGPVFLSITPSIEPPGTHYGRCEPQLLVFDPKDLTRAPKVEPPKWEGNPSFTDHSYRGVASDGETGEVLWLNIDAQTSIQQVSHRDAAGNWTYLGGIEFPIRSCYPQVALRGGAAHVLAIGDIVEPTPEWRAYKKEQTGRDWDFVFRRLFYTHTSKLSDRPFAEPLEVDTVESTGGYIANLDLWIGPDGAAHLLYLKTNIQHGFIRDRYFPGAPILSSLEYTMIKEGRVMSRHRLLLGGEIESGASPGYGRFHATPDGTLWAVNSATVRKEEGKQERRLLLIPVWPQYEPERTVEIELAQPFSTFFTATERGGSLPSYTLDLFGVGNDGEVLQYARVDLKP